MLFIGGILVWGIALITVQLNTYTTTADLIFIQLFQMETFLMGLNVLFFIVELLISFAKIGQQPTKPFNALLERKKANGS